MSTEDAPKYQSDTRDRLASLRAKQGLDISNFSKLVGVQRTYLSDIEKGKKELSLNAAMSISDTLGVSLDWLLRGIEAVHQIDTRADVPPSDFVSVPRYAVEASAGDGSLPGDEETTGFYAFNRKWLARRGLSPANLAVISVRGDSMEPKLCSGDLILIDRAQRQIADGLAFVVRLGTDLLVKHVQRLGPDSISLISANKLYPPCEIALSALGDQAGQIEVVGRVVASMHEW